MSINEVNGFSELDSYQQNKLSIVYAQHMYQTGEPDYYDSDRITKVEWDNEAHDIAIHFKNGNSYHYTMNGAWYQLDENGDKIILEEIK